MIAVALCSCGRLYWVEHQDGDLPPDSPCCTGVLLRPATQRDIARVASEISTAVVLRAARRVTG
jgi:hypothetical protein